MEPHDAQPGGSSNRVITLHLTRDTLLLIAALAFLIIAISLAVFFPAASSSNSSLVSTNTAQTQVAQAGVGRQTSPATASSQPTASAVIATPAEGYPVPNGSVAQNPTQVLEAGLATSLPNPPIFSPITSTVSVGIAGVPGQDYPAPATATATVLTTPVLPTATSGLPGQVPTVTPPVFQPPPTAVSLPELSPTFTALPTALPVQPTIRPTVTPRPAPTPTPVPPPTPVPVDVLRGNIRWTAAQSPILLNRDQQLIAGATLIIDPGVEVRLAPGVSFFVEGTLYALGKADRPVRFVARDTQRWEGLFGRANSNIALEYTDIRGGGAGGTLLTSEGGNLVLNHTHINDNGGHVQVTDSRLEMRDSEIAGNDMPYGAALDVSYGGGGGVTLTNNRIGGNRQQAGSPSVLITNQSTFDTVNMDIQANLFVGQDSPDLVFSSNGPLLGGVTCNTLAGGSNGLSIRSDTPQVPPFALNVRDNVLEKHTPPIIPIYLKYGLGRGATSEVALDMRNNWWGNPLGPYEPDRNADGRGDAVGDTIDFAPWLTARPACAPVQ